MLGYRSLFNVNDADRDVTSEVLAQVSAWLRGKRYDADRLAVNEDVAFIGPGVESVLTAEEGRDGSRSTLFRLREVHESNGTWITQVITHVPGHERGRTWVWIDVEQEDVNEGWAARPRVALHCARYRRRALGVRQGER